MNCNDMKKYINCFRFIAMHQKISTIKKKKKLYGPFLWMGFNCLKAVESLRGSSLLFTANSPEIPGTHIIDLGRMKG